MTTVPPDCCRISALCCSLPAWTLPAQPKYAASHLKGETTHVQNPQPHVAALPRADKVPGPIRTAHTTAVGHSQGKQTQQVSKTHSWAHGCKNTSKNLHADLLMLTKVLYKMLDFVLQNCNGTRVTSWYPCLDNNQNGNVGQNLSGLLGVIASSRCRREGCFALPGCAAMPGDDDTRRVVPSTKECQKDVKLQESS